MTPPEDIDYDPEHYVKFRPNLKVIEVRRKYANLVRQASGADQIKLILEGYWKAEQTAWGADYWDRPTATEFMRRVQNVATDGDAIDLMKSVQNNEL